KIAVLPFENLADDGGAGEKLQKIFLVELLKQNQWQVLEPGEVEQALKELRIRATDKLSAEQARRLQEKLGLDWIFFGTVLEFSTPQTGSNEPPVVSLTARILDAGKGEIIWAAFGSRQGDDSEFLFEVGKVNSTSELAKKIAEGMVAALAKKSRKG
ncbi:MAG TPA: hypothetical protein VFR89_05470, partial [candidate division Zixibacteria bacterium]|nr:hypothetical protein [candidate division Zixibacteria bacterium]